MPNQTVRLLNWNIQNYGKTKAQYSDIVNGIAKMVVCADPIPDIFVLVEINTTDDTTAEELALKMATALNAQSKEFNKRDEFKVAVLSQNTDLEYYGFFIRDPAQTKPLIAFNPATGKIPVKIGKIHPHTLTNVVFKEEALTGNIQVIDGFSLYGPDLDVTTGFGRVSQSFKWPGRRLPALGMFWLATANRLLPIFVCHYAPNLTLASRQFDSLKYFSLLKSMAPSAGVGTPPNVVPELKVKRSGHAEEKVKPGCYVLTGDFNADYLTVAGRRAYAPIERVSAPALGATVANTGENTLLMGYKLFKEQREHQITKLAIYDYDNFCLRVSPTAGFTVTSSDVAVYLTPVAIQKRFVRLVQSVDAYAELDQRGFISGDYTNIEIDFADQIGGDKSIIINDAGSLVGARLISDHLGVGVTYTITN